MLPIFRMRRALQECGTDVDAAAITQPWKSSQQDLLLVLAIAALYAAVAVIGGVTHWSIDLLLTALVLATLVWVVRQILSAWLDGSGRTVNAEILRGMARNYVLCWLFDLPRTLSELAGLCIIGMCSYI